MGREGLIDDAPNREGPSTGRATDPPGPAADDSRPAASNPGSRRQPHAQPAVPPPVAPARMRRRHRGLAVSFVLVVLIPVIIVFTYLWAVAVDQYASVTGFTVRAEESGNAAELIGGLATLTGSTVSTDGDILYEFILSQALVRRVDDRLDLVGHYSASRSRDPVFALAPDASIEDLERYWRRMVRISYDQNSGLTEVRVLAFTPGMAQRIAAEIVAESQILINALNDQLAEDAMRYARADLAEAVERLKTAREALTAFRTRTQIVDPSADLQGRMGILTNLQQQLAEALVGYDLLSETTSPDDPRLVQAQRRIDVIRERIATERRNFASQQQEALPDGTDYPSLLAEYEGLVVEREFAEETYRAALAAFDLARTQANRQSRYLATYVKPTLAETPEYPQRLTIAGLTALFLILAWSVLAMVYYAVRDRN